VRRKLSFDTLFIRHISFRQFCIKCCTCVHRFRRQRFTTIDKILSEKGVFEWKYIFCSPIPRRPETHRATISYYSPEKSCSRFRSHRSSFSFRFFWNADVSEQRVLRNLLQCPSLRTRPGREGFHGGGRTTHVSNVV